MGTQEKEESVTILRKAYRCLYIRLFVLKYALRRKGCEMKSAFGSTPWSLDVPIDDSYLYRENHVERAYDGEGTLERRQYAIAYRWEISKGYTPCEYIYLTVNRDGKAQFTVRGLGERPFLADRHGWKKLVTHLRTKRYI